MTRYHSTTSGNVPFTPEEEAAFDAYEAEQAALAIPRAVTMRQARLALLNAGLLDDVNAAIAAAGTAEQIEWEYAQEVSRSHGLVPTMATQLGMTSGQLDALFVAAAAL